jgi:hypothetical protein
MARVCSRIGDAIVSKVIQPDSGPQHAMEFRMGPIEIFFETNAAPEDSNWQVENSIHNGVQTMMLPDLQAIRNEALMAGAIDPATLRFRILELDKFDGTLLSIPSEDIGLSEALEQTATLVRARSDSHFCLEPVGFIQ